MVSYEHAQEVLKEILFHRKSKYRNFILLEIKGIFTGRFTESCKVSLNTREEMSWELSHEDLLEAI